MRVALQTWGSEGDIRPFRVLARHLAGRGHDVTFVITPLSTTAPSEEAEPYRTVRAGGAEAAGLDLSALRDRVSRQRSELLRGRLFLEKLLWPNLAQMDAAARDAVADCDVVVRHVLAYPALLAARDAGIPSVGVQLQPIPQLGQVPGRGRIGAIVNQRRRHGLLVGAGVDELLGVRPYRAITGRKPDLRGQDLLLGDDRCLLAASPSIVEPPGVDTDRVEVVGQLVDVSGSHEVPAEIEAFLEAGPPPVLVAPGSIAAGGGMDAETVGSLVDAIHGAGVRALLQVPKELMGRVPPGSGIRQADFIDHEAILARCAAVVHHGGAGTTHAVVRSGRPSVTVPYAADHFYWAERLHSLGATPAPVEARALRDGGRLDAERLSDAIGVATGDPTMIHTARELATAIRADTGVDRATAVIEDLVAARTSGSGTGS